MSNKEKLVELLQDGNNPVWGWFPNNATMVQLADYLIEKGVTVQEWISVEDRLPEENKSVLVYFDTGNMAVGYWYDKDECISFWKIWTDDGWFSDADCEPIYWMPLPPAPKGE